MPILYQVVITMKKMPKIRPGVLHCVVMIQIFFYKNKNDSSFCAAHHPPPRVGFPRRISRPVNGLNPLFLQKRPLLIKIHFYWDWVDGI